MTEDLGSAALASAIAESRRAIDSHGVSETAMNLISEVLRQLGDTLRLKDHASRLQALHHSDAAATVLASEGPTGLTMVLARFPPDEPTPVHDHGSWGIIYVLEGHDRYIHWQRLDDGSDAERAELAVDYEKILGPGDSVHWFDPPNDIHSQQGDRDTVLELVLFGHDAIRATRHYFHTDSGRITLGRPQ